MTALLSAAIGGAPLNVITDQMPAYQLPTPVPDVTAQLTVQADVTHVPADERIAVIFGIHHASRVVFAPPSTVTLRNAVWPVILLVRRGGATVGVRYELNFDAVGNVRAERLGEAAPRELPVAFTQLSVADKKARIVADFGLVAVDDRPANGARPVATWTPAELDQLKAAYDLLPASDLPSLAGVSVVRDHTAPPMAIPGMITAGFAHTGANAAFDMPGPPPHSPPHIHYFDAAFTANAVGSVGRPGSAGPGADWTLIHEVGHIRMFAATTAANAQITAANAQIAAANLRLPQLNAPIPVAVAPSRQAWSAARTAANTAIHAFHTAVLAGSGPAALAPLLAAAQAAVQARDRARANMTTVGVPAGVVAAALALDSAMDALLAASQATGAAKQQLPIFSSLAARFGFQKFTDYARRSVGDDEWFAETYALFVTDPDRLNQMSRNLFLWFSAGMPMDPNWNPPP